MNKQTKTEEHHFEYSGKQRVIHGNGIDRKWDLCRVCGEDASHPNHAPSQIHSYLNEPVKE